jgi:Mg2+ and Co2+ transporter CorA
MRKFIHDMIHMTEGEKLIHYWWLWALIILICGVVIYFLKKR